MAYSVRSKNASLFSSKRQDKVSASQQNITPQALLN